MNESHITGCIGSLMQFIVAGYALRLNRRYGTTRVGWSLFGAFSLLALLQLIQATTTSQATMDTVLKVNVTYALISFLLLIGMVHLESMLKERLRMENLEHKMRDDLETEVKSKTAHLTRAIEELMKEMEVNKRMAAMIEVAEATMSQNAAHLKIPVEMEPETTFAPTLTVAHERYDDGYGTVENEWLAHF